MPFCDWLNVWQQFEPGAYPDYLGGRVVSVSGACGFSLVSTPDYDTGEVSERWALSGEEVEVDYAVAKFAKHVGSFETSVMIRMVGGRLEVRGNPSAYGRLDNLFGLGVDEGIAVYNHILRGLGLPEFTTGQHIARPKQLPAYRNVRSEMESNAPVSTWNGARITRADITQNYAVGMGNVANFHKWLLRQKLYRSSPDDNQLQTFERWNYSTVYTSQSAYYMQAKNYDKAEALETRSIPEYQKKLKAALKAGTIDQQTYNEELEYGTEYLQALACWCAEQGVTRSEYSFRARYFTQHDGLGLWVPGITEKRLYDIFNEQAERVTGRAMVYQVDAMENLTPSEYTALDRWKKGLDVRETVSRATFYRLKTAILKKTGHDIGARPVALSRSIEARPVYFQMRSLDLSNAPAFYERSPFAAAA